MKTPMGHKPIKVRWIRHRTAEHLVLSHFNHCFDGPRIRRLSEVGGVGVSGVDGSAFAKYVRRNGMWAFVLWQGLKVPHVHYWHDGKRKPEELAYLLGHEVGHVSGKPRRGWAEENRADEYGAAAAAVIAEIKRVKP
jgi:hypothetical protein